MKTYKNILKGLVLLMVATAFLACEEDDDIGPTVAIEQLSVNSAFPGDPVSIMGSNFNTVQFIFVGDTQAPFTLDGNTISFSVPELAEVGNSKITLAMANNYRVTAPFEVTLRPVPVIEHFDAFVEVGGELTITGTSLNAEYNPSVMIDGTPATIVSNSASELVVTVPPVSDSTPLFITITTIHGETTTTTAFIAREDFLQYSQLEAGSGDDFTGWEKLNGGDGMTQVTGEEAYGGGRSMRVSGPAGNPWDKQLASTPTQLTFGEEYTAIVWARAEEEGAVMRVSISQFDGSGADYFYGADTPLETFWQPYTWTFTVTNDLPEHRLVLDMGHTDVPFLIDHIAIVPGALNLSGEKPEVLSNTGFEEDLTSGWEVLNGTLEATSADFYCGTQSLTATGAGGNPWDVQLASGPVDLEVGTMYELGFWAKAAGPDGVMRASISRFASGQSDDFFYTPDITVAEDWTYYSYTFTAQPTSTGNYNVVLDFGSTTQTFYLDDISLKEYDPPASLYAGGNFENDLAGWQILNGALATTTDEAYEGLSSLMATGVGGNPWDVQLASDPAVALDAGSNYRLSFWAKAAGPDGVMRASVSRFASGQSDDFFYTPDIAVAEDWTQYSYTFTAQATSTGDHFIVLDFGSTTQTFYLDNLLLYEVDLECD